MRGGSTMSGRYSTCSLEPVKLTDANVTPAMRSTARSIVSAQPAQSIPPTSSTSWPKSDSNCSAASTAAWRMHDGEQRSGS
jgi:hypothetical protein